MDMSFLSLVTLYSFYIDFKAKKKKAYKKYFVCKCYKTEKKHCVSLERFDINLTSPSIFAKEKKKRLCKQDRIFCLETTHL